MRACVCVMRVYFKLFLSFLSLSQALSLSFILFVNLYDIKLTYLKEPLKRKSSLFLLIFVADCLIYFSIINFPEDFPEDGRLSAATTGGHPVHDTRQRWRHGSCQDVAGKSGEIAFLSRCHLLADPLLSCYFDVRSVLNDLRPLCQGSLSCRCRC